MEILAQNSTYALVSALKAIIMADDVSSRAGETKEICDVHIVINNPLERCFVLKHRYDNIFAKIAETLWVLAGRNDIEWLSYYLPRAADFSDDGKTWRGGYGTRLRNFYNHDAIYYPMNYGGVDQLANVVALLKADSTTRRAVISLWDPSVDCQSSKDIPCNNWLHFLIRDGFLNMYVAQRSCDAIWGFSGINTFEWATLMQMMTYWTGTKIGRLSYMISSMHIYAKHFKRALNMVASFSGKTIYDCGIEPANGFCTDFYRFDAVLNELFNVELDYRVDKHLTTSTHSVGDLFMDNCLDMLKIYIYSKQPDVNVKLLGDMIMNLPPNDFKIAAIDHMSKQFESLIPDTYTFNKCV